MERDWEATCRALDLEWMMEDPRFISGQDRVFAHSDTLIGILEETFAKKTREEWREILDATDVLWAPVQDYMEALSDEQAIANEYVVEIDHPNAGKVKMLGLPIQFSETPGKVRSGAPELGQHTEELLTDLLDYSWDEVIGLKDKQVI